MSRIIKSDFWEEGFFSEASCNRGKFVVQYFGITIRRNKGYEIRYCWTSQRRKKYSL